MAATVARAMPDGSHRSIAGEWHVAADEIFAPVLVEFRTAQGARPAVRSPAAG